MRKKWFLFLCAAILALGGSYWATIGGEKNASRPHFEHSDVLITRADGKSFIFAAEVADSEEKQAYGLMFLHSLRDDKGMIFPFIPPKEVSFWMKNTYIPLDMLFVRPDGVLGRIAAEAQPEDLTPISSQGQVIAVIEINGGLSKKYGLNVGDKVESPALSLTH